MNFEELHNELNDFPEDLKYSDARWEEALAVIEAHEAKIAMRKKAGAALSILLLIGCGFIFYPFNASNYSEYTPREIDLNSIQSSTVQNEILRHEELNSEYEVALIESKPSKELGIKDVPVQIEEEAMKEINQASSKKISNNVAKDSESNSIPTALESQAATILEIQKIASENVKGQIEPSETNNAAVNYANQAQKADAFRAEDGEESNNFRNSEVPFIASIPEFSTQGEEFMSNEIEIHTPIGLQQEGKNAKADFTSSSLGSRVVPNSESFRLSKLNKRNPSLSFNLPRKKLASDKKIVNRDNSFRIYRQYFGGKIGVNPLAKYGRLNQWGGTNPSVGLYYENAISEKVFWNAGLEYFNISSIYLPVSSEETSYNYGFESNVLTVHTDRAHFVSAPIYLGVRPLKRVQLKLGGSLNILMETQNTLEEHHVTNESSTLLNQDNTRGYRTSFNSLGFTGAAAMNFWITETTSLQFTYHYGLSDFSRNDVFQNQTVNQNTRFELSINKVLR